MVVPWGSANLKIRKLTEPDDIYLKLLGKAKVGDLQFKDCFGNFVRLCFRIQKWTKSGLCISFSGRASA